MESAFDSVQPGQYATMMRARTLMVNAEAERSVTTFGGSAAWNLPIDRVGWRVYDVAVSVHVMAVLYKL